MRKYHKDKYPSNTIWTFERSDGLVKQYVKKASGSIDVWIMDVDAYGAIKVCEYKHNNEILVWNY